MSKSHTPLKVTDSSSLLRAGFKVADSTRRALKRVGKVTERCGLRPRRQRPYLILIFIENQPQQPPME